MRRTIGACALAGAIAVAPAALHAQSVTSIVNIAAATYQTPFGIDSVGLSGSPVSVQVVRPQFTLQISLLSATTAHAGDTVRYQVTYMNTGAAGALTGLVLIDTLPAGLVFAGSSPATTAPGGIARWSLPDLAPGTSAGVTMSLTVAAGLSDTVRVANRVMMTASDAPTQVAAAATVLLTGAPSAAIALAATVDVLQLSLGDVAPFTMVVRNAGNSALSNIFLHVTLAAGMTYSTGSATGADSVAAQGRLVTFRLPGTLAIGATRAVHFRAAVVSASTTVLQGTAYAIDQSTGVRSPDAITLVQVQQAMPMQDRAVIGKVWVDDNNNGVQDGGERGLIGLQIWDEDGEIATSDSAGRFSFHNIPAGQHGFRLDPASVPAGYSIAGSGLVAVKASGWTTPRVDFRLIPTGGRIGRVRLPQAQRVGARAADREVLLDSLPAATELPLGGMAEVTLVPPAAGWIREATFALPEGWDLVADSVGSAGPMTTVHDRNGAPVLVWRLRTPRTAPIVLMLRAVGSTPADTVRTATARTGAQRATEQARELLDGPGVRFTAPADGAVLAANRTYVGVRGERSTSIDLFDGDSLIRTVTTRIDGSVDFIALPLAPGSHRLRVRMQNSWGRERWDSIAVHVSERPSAFAIEPARIALIADGASVLSVRVRVLDRAGVPVITRPLVTVAATSVDVINEDADPSSVGRQVQVDEAGWLDLQLRPGHNVGRGRLVLTVDSLQADYPVDVLPAQLPLLLTAVGQVGLGASSQAFGALTLRGRLDDRTSIVASYDSRRLDAGVNGFGRTWDPLDPSQYPLLGDAGTQRTFSASPYQLALRVERGYDWLAVGDVSTDNFGQNLKLAGYRRALPGVAARITTGPVTWQAFGSSTSQSLHQQQLRGGGISGPYQLTGTMTAGTEQVVLEIRDARNAANIISRQVMVRYVDYQIDYQTGELLFKQPVPAADVYGNPVFIAVLAETDNGGPRNPLWGVHAALDAGALFNARALDSVRLGGTWVHESPGAGDHQLLGADLRVGHVGGLSLGAETSWSATPDSSGFAATADGSLVLLHGAARLAASWMNVGLGFANPSNVALVGGTEQLQLSAEFKSGSRQVRVSHEWERFAVLGSAREFTSATVIQPVSHTVQLEMSAVSSQLTSSETTTSQDGELKIHWKPDSRWTLTAEGRHQFALEGPNVQPDYIGADAAYAFTRDVSLDLRERMVFLGGDTAAYSVTDLGVKSRLAPGTDLTASYQLAGISGASNAALIGLHNSLRLGTAWALNAMFERRVGIDQASTLDPVRALPFVQAEESYWSAGIGAEYLQPKSPYRLTARAEMRDGSIQSTRLLTLAGDVSFSRSLAILSRNQLSHTEQIASGVTTTTHRYSTLWGLALRPVHSDALNVLGKYEYLDAASPTGGVLASPGEEGRSIFAGEAIWQPGKGTEFALRYAWRSTVGAVTAADSSSQQVRSSADFVGGRVGVRIDPRFEVRIEGRMLAEQTSATRRADVAPQLVFLPQRALEVVMGYRVGDLSDPDFAVNGGPGWFMTFGVHLTEATIGSAADFWRHRLAGRSQ